MSTGERVPHAPVRPWSSRTASEGDCLVRVALPGAGRRFRRVAWLRRREVADDRSPAEMIARAPTLDAACRGSVARQPTPGSPVRPAHASPCEGEEAVGEDDLAGIMFTER